MILHFALAVAALATSSKDDGRNLPETPVAKVVAVHRQDHPRRVWLAETVTLAGLYATDFTMTMRGLGESCGLGCGRMIERDPLYGHHPSNGRIAAIGGGIFVAESLLLHQTERSRHRWIRWSGRAFFAVVVADEVRCIHSWVR